MITSTEAAAVAKKHGLTLSDAAALARLADSPEEANELGAMFTPEDKRQWTRADWDKATAEEKVAARDRGQVRDLFAPALEETPPEGQLSRAQMQKLTPAAILEARAKGQLDWLLKLQPPQGQLSAAELADLTPAERAKAEAMYKTDWAEGRRERFAS
jgi:hypothetical protein